jgi:hypothetical protein
VAEAVEQVAHQLNAVKSKVVTEAESARTVRAAFYDLWESEWSCVGAAAGVVRLG